MHVTENTPHGTEISEKSGPTFKQLETSSSGVSEQTRRTPKRSRKWARFGRRGVAGGGWRGLAITSFQELV